jgi:hypothetical protein
MPREFVDPNNPFRYRMCGDVVQCYDASDRIDMVRTEFTPEQLRAALALSDLQVTVRTAIERRLRQIEKEGRSHA